MQSMPTFSILRIGLDLDCLTKLDRDYYRGTLHLTNVKLCTIRKGLTFVCSEIGSYPGIVPSRGNYISGNQICVVKVPNLKMLFNHRTQLVNHGLHNWW